MINREMGWPYDESDFMTKETFEKIKSDFVRWLENEAAYCRRIALDDFFTREERKASIGEVRIVANAKLEYLDTIKEDLSEEVEKEFDEFLSDLRFLQNWVEEHGDDRNKALGVC